MLFRDRCGELSVLRVERHLVEVLVEKVYAIVLLLVVKPVSEGLLDIQLVRLEVLGEVRTCGY